MASISKHVTRDVVTVDATAPISEAARIMADRKIGSVGVREGGKLAGLVTERDLVITVLARDGDGRVPVREAMRTTVPRVPASATETECSALMRDHETRHLLVEDGDGVVGIVSMRDIIQLMLDEKQFVIEQLQGYIGQGG